MESHRLRRRKSGFMKTLTQLDAFPKLEKNVSIQTESGGFATLIISIVILYLTFHEYTQYSRVQQKFEFLVDQSRSHHHGLQINFDMTVNMNCTHVRADILDTSGESLKLADDSIQMIPVKWTTEGSESFQDHENKRATDKLNRDTDVKNILSKVRGRGNNAWALGNKDGSACRFKGSANINKVTGMLHVTAKGYGYMTFDERLPVEGLNFTHRIDKLSFGKEYPGLESPLDGTMELTDTHLENFEYFVSVVPTVYVDATGTIFQTVILTNQYSVTEFHSHVGDRKSSHSLPGVFIKYSIEPISVRITAFRQTFSHFLVRLCGIIGGVFVTTGVVVHLLNFFRGGQKDKEVKLETELKYNRKDSSASYKSPYADTSYQRLTPVGPIASSYYTPYENMNAVEPEIPSSSVLMPIPSVEDISKDE